MLLHIKIITSFEHAKTKSIILFANNEFRLKHFCWEIVVFEGCYHLFFVNFESKEYFLTDNDTRDGSSLSIVLEVDHVNKHSKDRLRENLEYF